MKDKKRFFDLNNKFFCFDSESMRVFKIRCNNNKNLIKDKINNNIYESAGNISTNNPQKCSVLTFILTNKCNLNCSYCYYHNKVQRPLQEINAEQLFDSFKKMDSMFPEGIDLIQFFGGEPLIRYDVISTATNMISSYCDIHNRPCPRFGLNTNGLLLTDDMIHMFYNFRFIVSISIDGKEENNLCRCDYAGNPSYAKLVKNIERIHLLHPGYHIYAEMTFTSKNVQNFIATGIHDIEELHKLGFYAIHMVPAILSDEDEDNVFGLGCTQSQLFEYVKYAYDYMFDSFNSEHPIYIDDYLEIVKLLNIKQKKNVYCEAGISRFAIGPDGILYPCHMYLYDKYSRIGRFKSLNEKQLKEVIKFNFNEREKNNNEKCKQCWNKNLCRKCGFSIPTNRFCQLQCFKSEYLICKMIDMK